VNKLTDHWPTWLSSIGQVIARYGLALTLAWIGFGKYIKMESRVLIEHSPLMSWVYDVFSINTVARGLGTLEITAAILIVARPVSARLSAIGSAMAIVLFCGTLSFFVHDARRSQPVRRAGSGAIRFAWAVPAQRRCAAGRRGVEPRRGCASAPSLVSS
jgi:uncharacterized membrane protein YkgB